jgi:flagellar motor switch protein FliG
VSPSAPKALTSPRKAATLMVVLGEEAARKICERLPPDALRILAQEIAQLGSVAPEAAAEVLREYQQQVAATHESLARGGPDFATQFLMKTLGNEQSRPLVEQVRSLGVTSKNFELIQKANPEQIVKALQQEHPQTIALVLANLSATVSKAVLLLLPDPLRTQAVRRLAEMQDFSPEVVQKISAVLVRKLAAPVEKDRSAYEGVDTVADLLNRVGPKVTADLLAGIEKENANLAAKIRNQMFTFEDFVEVPESGLRELLGQLDKKVLATALKGASENLRNHFFKCMSSRAVEMMKEDMDALGPVKGKDVGQAHTDIVAVARKLESEGKMTLRNEEEDAYVV